MKCIYVKFLNAHNIICLIRLNQFYKSIFDSTDEWKQWYDSDNPQDLSIPDPYQNIDGFEKLIIIKCIRFDKVEPAIKVYIILTIDRIQF